MHHYVRNLRWSHKCELNASTILACIPLKCAARTPRANTVTTNTVWNHGERADKISVQCLHHGGMRDTGYLKSPCLLIFETPGVTVETFNNNECKQSL